MFSFPATHPAEYGSVVFKASHNSYARREQPLRAQLPYDRDDPHQAGCRGVELDIAPNADTTAWSVAHSTKHKPDPDKQLSVYLSGLRTWSEANAGHDLITLTLDLKKVPPPGQNFSERLDAYIRGHLGADRLVEPDEIRGTHLNLRAAVTAGWPILGNLTGRFLVCLSGVETAKRIYVEQPIGRACFADRKISPNRALRPEDHEWRVFLNVDMGAWMPALDRLKELADTTPYMIRAYFVNEENRWNAARLARVNIIATDKVRDHDWATVGPLPFELTDPPV